SFSAKKIVNTAINPNQGHRKQVEAGPSATQTVNLQETTKMIMIPRNDLRQMFEEWAVERGMMPPPPTPPVPEPVEEQREASAEPYVPKLVPNLRVRRRLFLVREKEELPPPPPLRSRAYERARKAPFEEVNSMRNTVAEEELQREEEICELSEQVDRLSRRLEDLRRPLALGPDISVGNGECCVENGILAEILGPNVKIPYLPKYHGDKDPKEHLAAYDNILQSYGLLDAFCYLIFVTTLCGRIQDWFSSLVPITVVSYDQLAPKFLHHFSSKKKARRSATCLFTIRQKDDESFRDLSLMQWS
ncbi:UNVERIFIED_CONTAM: hypothetical protein Sindi_0012400, partial [Sesamum indicum]